MSGCSYLLSLLFEGFVCFSCALSFLGGERSGDCLVLLDAVAGSYGSMARMFSFRILARFSWSAAMLRATPSATACWISAALGMRSVSVSINSLCS